MLAAIIKRISPYVARIFSFGPGSIIPIPKIKSANAERIKK